jgi:hypothetical protein
MWPQLVDLLPMKMRLLHNWYMEQSKEGREMFVACVHDRDCFRGQMTYGLNLKVYGFSTIKTLLTNL